MPFALFEDDFYDHLIPQVTLRYTCAQATLYVFDVLLT